MLLFTWQMHKKSLKHWAWTEYRIRSFVVH